MALVPTVCLITARLAPLARVYTVAEVQVALGLWLGAILLVRIPLGEPAPPDTAMCAAGVDTSARSEKCS